MSSIAHQASTPPKVRRVVDSARMGSSALTQQSLQRPASKERQPTLSKPNVSHATRATNAILPSTPNPALLATNLIKINPNASLALVALTVPRPKPTPVPLDGIQFLETKVARRLLRESLPALSTNQRTHVHLVTTRTGSHSLSARFVRKTSNVLLLIQPPQLAVQIVSLLKGLLNALNAMINTSVMNLVCHKVPALKVSTQTSTIIARTVQLGSTAVLLQFLVNAQTDLILSLARVTAPSAP